MNVAENEDNDAIIQIADAIRKQFPGQEEFAVEYADLEQNWLIPEGNTAKYIEQAADDLGYEVTRKGTTRANLRRKVKPTSGTGRIVRS
jgi:hypothetical protein